jgi:ubiquitin domain-containing protein
MPLDSVALDLCREVEARDPALTPLRLFLREGPRGHQIRGPEPLFGKASSGVMPVFEPLHSSESMKLHVRTMTGQTVDITAASENTLDDLKIIWQNHTGLPPSMQRFIYGARQLEEGVLISPDVGSELTCFQDIRWETITLGR